jgi:hypothetical protein
MYADVPLYQGGGVMFRSTWGCVMVSVHIKALVMVAMFSLKKQVVLVVLEVLVLLGLLGFHWVARKRYWPLAEHGCLVDGMHDETDTVPSHFPDLYVHPGLIPIQPELLSNGDVVQ